MLHAVRPFVSLLFLLIFLNLSWYYSSLSQDNRLIHSTCHKIILSTQPCPFSTCQLNPCFHRTAGFVYHSKEQMSNASPTLRNALFSSLFRYLLLYFSHQYYALNGSKFVQKNRFRFETVKENRKFKIYCL